MGAEVIDDFKKRSEKAMEALQKELGKVRTGRANLQILDGISVDYYGTPTPLNQVASLAVPDAKTITVKPWDKSVIAQVEKAINIADIGIAPQTSGDLIRLPIPVLTEERRKELVKIIRQKGEDSKIVVRNIRRDANEQLKDAKKDKSISEDEMHKFIADIQKETDACIKLVDKILDNKEKELMEI